MQTYLYLHKESTAGPQERYRGTYLLKHMDYELRRAVGRKGEAVSGVQGGEIRVVIDGVADAFLAVWVFDAMRREDGAIVTLDEAEKVVSKLHFSGATVAKFRFNYDSRVKEGTATVLTLVTTEITTDNDLHYGGR